MRLNRTETARVLGCSLPTLANWVAEGLPVAKRGARGRAYAFELALVVAWVRERDTRRAAERLAPNGPATREQLRDALRRLWMPWELMSPTFEGADVLELDAYAHSIGLADEEGAELFDWLQLGLPMLPPAKPGGKLRVSRPHAELWRVLVADLIGHCGGDGTALHLGREMRRLCGIAPSLAA